MTSAYTRLLRRGEISHDDFRAEKPLEQHSLCAVDALQLVVSLEKNFGLKISDTSQAKEILQSVNSIAATLLRLEQAKSIEPAR